MNQKPIKVFVPDGDNFVFPGLDTHSLPFDIEADLFVATSDFAECDVVPVMGGVEPDRRLINLLKDHPNKLIFLFVFSHVSEGDHSMYHHWYGQWSQIFNNLCVITTNYRASQCASFAYNYDFLFNRQKAYYVDYDKHVKDSAFLGIKDVMRLWSGQTSHRMYSLPLIEKIDCSNPEVMHNLRKFIVPNKNDITLRGKDNLNTHMHLHERTMYRHLFIEYVEDQGNQIHYADWSRTPPKTLSCQEPGHMKSDGSNFTGWWPLSNSYYDTSLINAYVETLVNDNQVRCITEKTFEPMIKGNFVLPFGYQGLIKDIVEQYGFKLPNWINYDYDNEPDRTKRFYLYTREFVRLRDELSTYDLADLRNRDIDLLIHNRQVFYQRPYHSLYNILYQHLNTQTNQKISQ